MKKEDFKPCGYLTICNWGGIEVMINNSGDAVIYSWFGKIAQRWQEIKHSAKGREYCVSQMISTIENSSP